MKMFMLMLVLSMLKVFMLILNTWIVLATSNLILMMLYKTHCLDWFVQLLGEVR